MIKLDDRIGSGELLPMFRPFGVTVQKVRLDFADVCWEGWGPKGRVMVGLERKKLDDLIQCMHDGRLSGHQLPGLCETYDYAYLVVEGIWKTDSNGEVVELSRRGDWVRKGIQARAINNYLMGLSLRAGLIAWKTSTDRETVEFIVDQYKMWEKRWEEHKAHERIYTGGNSLELAEQGAGRRLFLNVRPPNNVELVASVMPGLGAKLAYRVGKKFGNVMNMVLADELKWAEIKGISKEGGRKLRQWFYE